MYLIVSDQTDVTHSVSPRYGVRLFAEAEVLLPGEDLVDELAVEHGHLGAEGLQLLQQDGRALLDLAPRQVRGTLRGPRHHVRETDAEVQQLQHITTILVKKQCTVKKNLNVIVLCQHSCERKKLALKRQRD